MKNRDSRIYVEGENQAFILTRMNLILRWVWKNTHNKKRLRLPEGNHETKMLKSHIANTQTNKHLPNHFWFSKIYQIYQIYTVSVSTL